MGPTGVEGAIYAGEGKLARALAMGGAPAFIRRARALELAVAELHARLETERNRRLRALLPAARSLELARSEGARIPKDALGILDAVRDHPDFGRRRGRPARGLRAVARGLRQRASRFNRLWRAHLASLSLDAVHALQRDYNRFYPIEREVALRGVRLPPFRDVALLERDELIELHPPLPIQEQEEPT